MHRNHRVRERGFHQEGATAGCGKPTRRYFRAKVCLKVTAECVIAVVSQAILGTLPVARRILVLGAIRASE
jgi:hypothetical protein